MEEDVTQKLLGQGSESWHSFDFTQRPSLERGDDWKSYEFGLYKAFLEFQVDSKKDVQSFLKVYKEPIDKMPVNAKKFFIQDFTENFYLGQKYSLADSFLNSFGLTEKQKEGVLFWTAIRAMEYFTDPDGVTTWTEPWIAKRIVKSYKHFLERPEFKETAEKGFLLEIGEIGFLDDPQKSKNYIDLGLISNETLQKDNVITAIKDKTLQLLGNGYGRTAAKVLEAYSVGDDFLSSPEVLEKAETGFAKVLDYLPDEARAIAREFLPRDYLDRPSVRELIKNTYISKLEENLINVLEIAENFEDYLPQEITGERIWQSDYAEKLKKGIFIFIENDWHGIENVKARFGIPKDILQDETFKKLVIETLRDAIKWADRERADNVILTLELEPEIWREVLTSDFLEKIFSEGRFDRFTEFLGESSAGIEADPKELETFVNKIVNGDAPLNSEMLKRLSELREALPQVAKYFDILAGPNYPQGATVNDLIDLTQTSILVSYAIEGLYMFTSDEVKEVARLLDEGENSHRSVPFFNVLKRSGVLKSISESEKGQLIYWVKKWGERANKESANPNTPENKKLIRGHWARYNRLGDEKGSDVISGLYRYKAAILADAIEMFGDTKNIDAIGKVLDSTDPNKLYLMGRKDLRKLLIRNFLERYFPDI